jgi:endonuclease III
VKKHFVSNNKTFQLAISEMISASAADRNKEPILKVLQEIIPSTQTPLKALEIASGTGQCLLYLSSMQIRIMVILPIRC